MKRQAVSPVQWSGRELAERAATLAERALLEYFDSRGDVTPGSSFGRMLSCIPADGARAVDSWHVVSSTGGRGLTTQLSRTEVDLRLLRLCDEHRPIRRVLAAIGARAETILEIGCLGPTRGLEAFGSRAALALSTTAALEAYAEAQTLLSFEAWIVNLSWRVRNGAASSRDRLHASDIAREAVGLWRGALAAFIRAGEIWEERERERARIRRAARRALGLTKDEEDDRD